MKVKGYKLEVKRKAEGQDYPYKIDTGEKVTARAKVTPVKRSHPWKVTTRAKVTP